MSIYTRTEHAVNHLTARGLSRPLLRVHTEPGPSGAVTVIRPGFGRSWSEQQAQAIVAAMRDLIGVTSVRLAEVTDRVFVTWVSNR